MHLAGPYCVHPHPGSQEASVGIPVSVQETLHGVRSWIHKAHA